jgi:pimeloyl-ACP methyl ester carboxylesterase
MKQTIAGLLTEHFPPEKPKFKSPVVMVHGLWTGSWCWQRWATHFCNLGWDCWAVNLRGRVADEAEETLRKLSFARCVDDLTDLIASFSSPPLVLAHSMGALMALKVAEMKTMAALVLASPPPPQNLKVAKPRALRLLRLKYLLLMTLGRPFRLEEKDLRKIFWAPLPPSTQAEISCRIVPESPRLAGEFFRPRIGIELSRLRCPRLVLAGGKDQMIAPATSHAMAQWLGADFKEYPDQGHWIIEVDGEPIVRDIHRWVVQKLSDQILLAEFPPSL